MASTIQKTNRAAWQLKSGAPQEVGDAPYPTPSPHQLVLRTRAVAINPVDWVIQDLGTMIFSWLKFPGIYGEDVAGEVLEVGSAVTRFKPGDRVFGMGLATGKTSHDSTQAAFQECVLLQDHICAKIPAEMSFEAVSVMPLAICTAATGLYQKDFLALPLPKHDATPSGKTLLIWGGSTSVGTMAIQLACASGFEVTTTCSPKNFGLVKKLGASHAFDYNSPSVVSDIATALKGKPCAGAYAAGTGAAERCLDVLALTKSESKFVAMASPPGPGDPPSGILGIVSFLVAKFSADARVWWKCWRNGLSAKFLWGGDMAETEVGPGVWVNYLEEALAKGKFMPSPEPMVVPTKGLEGIQEGFEILKKGVSAKKVVVSGI